MAKSERNPLRELVFPVFLPSLVYAVGENALIPMIPASAERLGANLATASIIAGMIMVGTLLADIPASKLIARIGERRGMLYSAFAAAGGLAITALATNLWTMALGISLVGASAAVFALARHTYIAENVPYENRGRSLSVLGGMFRAGGFLGPLLSGLLITLGDLNYVYWVALGLCATAGFLVMTTKKEIVNPEDSQNRLSTWHITKREWNKLSTLGVASALLAIVRTARIIGLPLWALYLHINPGTAALIIGAAAGLDVALFYTSGQIMDRWGRRAAAVPTMLLLGLTMFLIPLTHDAWGLLIVGLVMSLANGLGSGIIMTIGADLAPADARGEFLAAFRLLIDGSTSLTAPILSIATATVGLGFGFVLVGAMSISGAWLMFKHIPIHIKHPQE